MSAGQTQFDFSGARPAPSAGTNGARGAEKADIVAKLRKLMNTNGRTEAERDSAEILAAALAAKHGIDLQQIELAAERPSMVITERVVGQWFSKPKEASYAAGICVKYFEVSQVTVITVYDGAKETFVGLDWHLDIAEHVFRFLIREFRYAWTHRKNRRIKNRNAFLHGAYVGLLIKLNERFDRGAASGIELSWKAKREAYMEENHPDTESSPIAPKQKSSAALSHGIRAGGEIEIRPAVKPGATVRHGELPAGIERRLLGAAQQKQTT